MDKNNIKYILKEGKINSEIIIKGWIRTFRESKNISFITLNDGTTIKNLQIIVEPKILNQKDNLSN